MRTLLLPALVLTACTPDTSGSQRDRQEPCPGAPDATAFDIYVDQVVILPFKSDGEPWDWDGQVPDWLLKAVSATDDALSALIETGLYPSSPEALTAAELVELTADILDAIDEHAPGLLEATVPPDVYAELVVVDGRGQVNSQGFSETTTDSYAPEVFTQWPAVPQAENDLIVVDLWDEDAVFDDWIASFGLDHAASTAYADCGPLTVGATSTDESLQLVTLEIVSHP
jgi:hypothetical protein